MVLLGSPAPSRAEDAADAIHRANVAVVSLYQQGRHAEALDKARSVLDKAERALGPEHPETLSSINNLAFLYRSQGQCEKAEPLQRRALEVRERVLGPEHPKTLTSVTNLAGLYLSWPRESGQVG